MDKFDVVLAEYKALRDEITDKFRLYLQIYSMYASALLIFYGLVFVHKIYDLVMAIPIFSLALLYRILWEQMVINQIGWYIRTEIEGKKILALTGKMDAMEDSKHSYINLWMGWQHFWQEWQRGPYPKYYQYSLLMLFLLLSVVPAILYDIYNIIAHFTTIPKVTILNIYFLVLLLILNLSLGCYMYYKIIKP